MANVACAFRAAETSMVPGSPTSSSDRARGHCARPMTRARWASPSCRSRSALSLGSAHGPGRSTTPTSSSTLRGASRRTACATATRLLSVPSTPQTIRSKIDPSQTGGSARCLLVDAIVLLVPERITRRFRKRVGGDADLEYGLFRTTSQAASPPGADHAVLFRIPIGVSPDADSRSLIDVGVTRSDEVVGWRRNHERRRRAALASEQRRERSSVECSSASTVRPSRSTRCGGGRAEGARRVVGLRGGVEPHAVTRDPDAGAPYEEREARSAAEDAARSVRERFPSARTEIVRRLSCACLDRRGRRSSRLSSPSDPMDWGGPRHPRGLTTTISSTMLRLRLDAKGRERDSAPHQRASTVSTSPPPQRTQRPTTSPRSFRRRVEGDRREGGKHLDAAGVADRRDRIRVIVDASGVGVTLCVT